VAIHSLVLIIHVTAVFVLCSVLCVEGLSLVHLRGASTLAEALPWIEPVRRLRVFAVSSVLTIQISGIYLVYRTSSFGKAWANMAMVALPLLMVPFGNITARRMRAIRQVFRSKEASKPESLGMLRAHFLKISLGVRTAAFFGIFILVSIKPGLWGSVGFVGTFLILSLLLSVVPWRSSKSITAPGAGVD
jgi:hypothetical protein